MHDGDAKRSNHQYRLKTVSPNLSLPILPAIQHGKPLATMVSSII